MMSMAADDTNVADSSRQTDGVPDFFYKKKK